MKDKGVVLFGYLKGDAKAPGRVCVNLEPCNECVGYMRQGVILISVRDEGTDKENPYRTGGWAVVKDEAIKRMLHEGKLVDQILEKRFAFVPDEAWVKLGLPGLKAVRDRICMNKKCSEYDKKIETLVEYGPTPNISGEKSVWCEKCGGKMAGEPVRYVITEWDRSVTTALLPEDSRQKGR
jgi:hypothetical protein